MKTGRKRAMTYGLSTRVPAENGHELAAAFETRSRANAWRMLDEAGRLALIERALSAANDRIDGYPLAL
jgi:hypothetical protein